MKGAKRMENRQDKKLAETIARQKRQEVVIKDIEMSFSSMVTFMVKWAIAAIPAAIILGLLVAVFWGFLLSLLGIGR